MKKLILSVAIIFSLGASAGVYTDLIFPALTMCDDFASGNANIKITEIGYATWEGGRHNRLAECIKPIASPAPGGPTEEVVASVSIKSGDGDSAATKDNDKSCNKCKKNGSIISMDDRGLGEMVTITGAPFNLIYDSTRAEGYKLNYKIRVPVSDPSPLITNINVNGIYAGSRTFSQDFSNVPNEVFTFTWDGKDSSGNLMSTSTPVLLRVVYRVYGKNIPVIHYTNLGGWNAKFLKMGRWQPDIYHQYDVARGLVERADGTFERKLRTLRNVTEYHVSSDEGDEIFVFDAQGVHLKTLFGITGATKFLFTHTGGLLTSVTDAYGQVTTFTRDSSSGLVTSITSPKGQVTTLTYNGTEDLAMITKPNTISYSMTYYGTTGLLETFTKPEGEVSTFVYDADGGLVSDTHSGGYYQTLSQERVMNGYPMKRVTLETPMGRKDMRDIRNVLETSGESHGLHTTQTTDFTNHRKGLKLESIEKPGSHTYSMSYKDDPRMLNTRYIGRYSLLINGKQFLTVYDRFTTLSDSSNPFSIESMTYKKTSGTDISYSYYNGTAKEWTSVSTEGLVEKEKIDSLERVIETQVGALEKTYYSYFTDGRLAQIKQGDRVTKFFYDANGNLSKTIDPLGRIMTRYNDVLGRAIAMTSYDGRKTEFFYDENSRLTGILTPHKKDHTFVYNDNELLESYFSPQIGAQNNETFYEYNLDKQLSKVILPDSREVEYIYGSTHARLDRIVTDEFEMWYQYQYNKAGPVEIKKFANSKNIWLNYVYSGPDVASETVTTDGSVLISKVSYSYDNKFRLGQISFKDGQSTAAAPIVYAYNKDDRMLQAGELKIERDKSLGFISKLKLKNAEVNYSVDSKYGELSKIEYRQKGIPQFFREFKRDKLGRIIEESTPEGSYTFLYDKGGRFLGRSLKGSGTPVSNFIYDKNGNRIRGNDNGKVFKAEFDDQDRMVKFNNTTITYNLSGQISSKVTPGVGTTTYSYDSFGNLLEVQTPVNHVKYEVDGRNRRTEVRQFSSTFKTRYVWDGQLRIIAELASNNALVKKYVYAEGINSPEYMIHEGKKYLFVKDHRGSVNLVVNAETGEIKQKLRYSEWGEVLEDTNPGFQPFGFAGGLYDGVTKLYRFGARDYDPEIGRWLSKDPIRFKGGDTNLYGYVVQDPVNFIDPKGTLSPASIAFCTTVIGAGKAYDTLDGINEAAERLAEINEEVEDIDEELKTCKNETRRLKLIDKKNKLLEQYQKESLGQAAGILTTGAGTAVGGAMCVAALVLF